VSLIVIVDTYFLVDGILAKVDDIASIAIDKQNELTKVEKGIYSVAKREEIARAQSMSALLDMILEIKDENAKLYQEMLDQDKLMSKLMIKKDGDNTTKIVNSNERLAVLIAQTATSNAKSQNEAIEILNDICKELEQRNGNMNSDYSHLRLMRSRAE
jgi:ABC-type lipopolysaccharide export system ATPase subunit